MNTVALCLYIPVHSPTLLYNQTVQFQLHVSFLHNPLLHRVLCDKAEHADLLHLADTMSSILGNHQKVMMCSCKNCTGTDAHILYYRISKQSHI